MQTSNPALGNHSVCLTQRYRLPHPDLSGLNAANRNTPNVFRPIQRGDQHLQIPGLINIRTGDFIHHLVQQACHILRPDRMI